MSKIYSKTPSELIGLEDSYTSYCLNEACAFIQGKMQEGEMPSFAQQYKSFTDLYKQYKKG